MPATGGGMTILDGSIRKDRTLAEKAERTAAARIEKAARRARNIIVPGLCPRPDYSLCSLRRLCRLCGLRGLRRLAGASALGRDRFFLRRSCCRFGTRRISRRGREGFRRRCGCRQTRVAVALQGEIIGAAGWRNEWLTFDQNT